MSQNVTWATPANIATALSTELNSLANGSYSNASSAIANATAKARFIAVELVLASLTPVANQTVTLWLLPSVDGTNYPDGGGSTAPEPAMALCTFRLTNATRAFRLTRANLPIPPLNFTLVVSNDTITSGANLAAANNTVKYVTYGEAVG